MIRVTKDAQIQSRLSSENLRQLATLANYVEPAFPFDPNQNVSSPPTNSRLHFWGSLLFPRNAIHLVVYF